MTARIIMETAKKQSIKDKQAIITKEWEAAQSTAHANAVNIANGLAKEFMPGYNQLFSQTKITPSAINKAIEAKRNEGKLMDLNGLFDLFIENDDNLQHCVGIRKEVLKKARWKYGSKLTKAAAEEWDGIIRRNLPGWVDQFVEGKLYGHHFLQVLFGTDESGKYNIAETIDYHGKCIDMRVKERKLQIFTQDKPVELNPEIKFITKLYKQAPLQSILKYYVFYSFALNNWAQFTETYGKPTRIGTYKPTASPAEVDLLKRMVKDLGTDQAAIISETCQIEFKDFAGKTTSSDLYQTLCDFVESRVTKAVLGQTLTTNSQKIGTQALGTVQNEVRKDIRDGDLRDMGQLVGDVLTRLALLNGATWSGVEFYIDEPINLTDRMAIVTGAARLGLKITTEYMYGTFDIPRPKEGEEVLIPTPPPAPTDAPPTEDIPGSDFNDRIPAVTGLLQTKVRSYSKAQSYLNAAIDEMVPVLLGIRQRIRGCETIEQLKALNLYDEAAELGSKLGAGVARSYVAGRQITRRKGESVANYELRLKNYEFINSEAIIQFGWNEQDVELVNVFRTQVMTIAGVRTAEQLKILKDAAISAMEEGGGFHEYIKNADLAGFSPENPYHFRTEYDTAFGSAQMAGQWQGIQEDSEIFPYLRYVTMQDDLVRDEHAALEGYIAAVDDPFWASNYPPNGWNCRCDVEQLMQDEAEADPKYGQAPEEVPVTEGFASNAGMTGSLPNNTDRDFEQAAYDYIAARLPDWAVKPKYDDVNASIQHGQEENISNPTHHPLSGALPRTPLIDWAGYPILRQAQDDKVAADMLARPGEVWQKAGNELLILKRYDSYTGVLAVKRGKCGVCEQVTNNPDINAKRRGILVYGT
jgi:SPP1 gp7 family putative phage head morphogenesis protein